MGLDLWLNVENAHVLCCPISLLPQKILTEKERKREEEEEEDERSDRKPCVGPEALHSSFDDD